MLEKQGQHTHVNYRHFGNAHMSIIDILEKQVQHTHMSIIDILEKHVKHTHISIIDMLEKRMQRANHICLLVGKKSAMHKYQL